jgi:hypothetical protein
MTKDQKRIVALEKEVKELREEIIKLAMRPQYIYVQPQQPAVVNPAPITPWQPSWPPMYPIVTCEGGLRTTSGGSLGINTTSNLMGRFSN